MPRESLPAEGTRQTPAPRFALVSRPQQSWFAEASDILEQFVRGISRAYDEKAALFQSSTL